MSDHNQQKTPRMRWGSSECFGRAITLNAQARRAGNTDRLVEFVTAAQGLIPGQAEHGTTGILRIGYASSARQQPSGRGDMLDVATVDAVLGGEAVPTPKTEVTSQRVSGESDEVSDGR